ncbi:hypothetical protein [Radiobacillus deserti]|uniref:DUF4030 domain-containing protein n=1 Tax=Radiobacillus deserti TaxID=2594883 RepID=A0A516KIE9_9BACI|nr:hypothetical protein [Radiobacillus deserti]QDP41126.1 hypothetical protein FN924_13560 [Radiobacillus deserti]
MKRNYVIISSFLILIVFGVIWYLAFADQQRAQAAYEDISEVLSQQHDDIVTTSYGVKDKQIEVKLSDKASSTTRENVQQFIEKELKDRKLDDITVSVEIVNSDQQEKETTWMSPVPNIDTELKRKGVNYAGISIDWNPKPLTYYINTAFTNTASDKEEARGWL